MKFLSSQFRVEIQFILNPNSNSKNRFPISANQNQQSFAYSTSTTACSSIPTMLSGSSSLILDQNGNTRDRTHLSLDLRGIFSFKINPLLNLKIFSRFEAA